MKLTRSLFPAVLAGLVLAGCAHSRLKVGQSDQGEVVEAEGLAPNDPSDLIKTKRNSLTDAQRNAVEKAVGVYVSAKTFVEQAIAIENDILAKTDGYIKKFDILGEKVEDGFYKTRIRALVALKDLEQDLRESALLKTSEVKRPRVFVDITEEIEKKPHDSRTTANALQKSLSDQGYVVVQEDRKKEAELWLKGKAQAYPFQASGLGGFLSYRARLNLEVVRAGTNDVVLSLSKEASGLGGNEDLAALKAFETVGDVAGQALNEELNKKGSKARMVLIFVEGVESFEQVDRIRKHLEAMPGVTDLSLRLYDEKMAQFDVQMGKSDTAELAVHLEKSKTLPLKVLETNTQTIRLKME